MDKRFCLDQVRAARQKRNIRRFKRYFNSERCKEYYHPLKQIAEAQEQAK